ncbi:MAG: hypothetical protein IH847_06505, partial [Acidobacteria bacterium]|nr:hypothetical protein [Acidobacteriota bacterium]
MRPRGDVPICQTRRGTNLDESGAEAQELSQERRMNDLLAWRKEFPILSTTTYMISNSLGAMP